MLEDKTGRQEKNRKDTRSASANAPNISCRTQILCSWEFPESVILARMSSIEARPVQACFFFSG